MCMKKFDAEKIFFDKMTVLDKMTVHICLSVSSLLTAISAHSTSNIYHYHGPRKTAILARQPFGTVQVPSTAQVSYRLAKWYYSRDDAITVHDLPP